MSDKVRLQEALAELQAFKRLAKEMASYIETSTRDNRHPRQPAPDGAGTAGPTREAEQMTFDNISLAFRLLLAAASFVAANRSLKHASNKEWPEAFYQLAWVAVCILATMHMEP